MDTIDNAILALTANIEFKNAIKELKNFQKKNKDFELNVTTDKLEEAYYNFVKKANKNTVQAFNFSRETGKVLEMSKREMKGIPKEDVAFYNDFYSKLEKYTARMDRANSFVKDMVEQLGKTEEEIIEMISRMSSTDIKNLVGNKTNEYGKWEEARKRAKTLRGQNYGETARQRADNIAIQRENQGTRAFKNAYVENGFTDAEKKGIDAIAGKVDDKDLQKIIKDYLELETILKRVEAKKEELSQIDNKDEATLKQILQVTADASRLRMLMGQDITKSNGAIQKFAESNKELKLVDPETETSENRKQKIQEARKPLMLFYQQELEREANDATDSIIKMFKEAFERAKASISESADTFGSLGNIDKSVRKYIQNINSAKDAEQKLLEVSEKLKGSKGVITSENIEYAKDGVGYLRRYVELGGDINKLYEKISPSMKQFFDNFSNGQVAPEFMNEFQKIYEEVGKAKDLKIGFGVGNGEGTGSVGQVNDELERQSQIVEKLGEDYKNVAKYAVGAEEALAKVEELAKRSNSKKGITDLERKDMIGYAARFNAINTNYNLAFSEVAQKAIEDNQKKYFATANKVTEMSKKLSSSASDTGNGVGGITPEQLKTLTGYLQQIIDKLKEIKDLSNNKTSLFNDSNIEKFTQSMQEAINKLDFSKVSESIEKINFKAISEEAEKAIITIAKKFETLGEQIAQNIANGINNGVKISEDTIVPKNEEIKKEVKEDKAETKPEKKVATIEDLDKEVERYTELKTKITDCDTELEKLKSRRKEPIISPEDIDGIENYLHKLSQVRDSKSSMYDTSSDDNFNFVSKDNSDELSKLEISLDNLIQKCEPLKNFTFDFEQFASAEEASEALTDALEQELSVLKQVDPELEKQITTLSNSRATMTSQLNKSVNSITNMKKELGVDTTILDLDEAVNKLNALNKEIVDCEEKIRSLKETEKTSLVSEQDIQQMKQLNEVFKNIKYNPRSFDVTESWQEFDTMLGKSNVNEEIKTKLSKTAREITQTSSMTGNPVSIQKQILEMLQREITEQESLVSANRDKIKVENEEVIVTQNRLTQLQQEKSELQEMVNLIKEKLQLQSVTTSQPSNQIPVSSGNTPSSSPSISDGLKSENEQLGENVSKYQEIVSLVQEYYDLIQKLQKPTIEFQKYNEEYARVDQYLRNQAHGKPIDPSDPDTKRKIIHRRYKEFAKGINNGDDFALKAIKSAIYDYWANATEMPDDKHLLSSTSFIEGGGRNSKYTTVIPKKYKELEQSVIQETIVMNKNNASYEEERKQVEANNAALQERMSVIRNLIKSNPKNSDYDGDYIMGLSLKASDKNKTDIFSMANSMSCEDMLKEICNMLGVEIPQAAEKANKALSNVDGNENGILIPELYTSADGQMTFIKEAVKSEEQLAEETRLANEELTKQKALKGQSTRQIPGQMTLGDYALSNLDKQTQQTITPVQTDNIQKILAENSALSTLSQTLEAVIRLVKDKTTAFVNEGTTVDSSIHREVAALNELDGWLQAIKREVDLITTTIATLPSINIKADLSGLNSDKLTEDIVKKFSELSKALKDTDTSNITSEGISALNSLNISKNAGVNLQKVANAIANIKASLNNLGDGGKAFIEDIKEIVNAGEALKNFNEILKKTKTERKEAAKQATGQSEDKPKTKAQQSNELYGALSAKKKEYLKLLKSLTYAKDEQDKATITQTMSKYEQETAEIQKQIESQKLVNQAKQAAIDIIDDNIAREEYLNEIRLEKIAERNEWTQANTVNLAEQLGSEEAVKELGNLGTEWDKALKAAYDYKNVLGDTVDIVRQIRRDSKGDYYESYTITGKDGNQITKGKDGTYLMSRQKVVDDLTQQKAREKESKKNKNTTTTTSSNNKIISEYKELISLEEQLHALKTKQAVGFSVTDEDINKVQREIDTKKAGIEKIKETTALTQKETDAQAEYNNKVAELQNMYSKNSVGFSGITDFTSRLEQVKTNIPELSNSVQDTYTKIEKLTESFAQGKTSITDYQKKINKLVTDLENVEQVIPGGTLAEGENALRDLFAEKGIDVKKISRNKDQTKVTFSGTQLDETKKKLVEVAGTFDALTGKVSYFEKGTSKAMTSLQKSISAFKGKMQSVVRYFATFVGVYEVIGAIKSGVSTVIEFNTALSEMRKVSSASTATLKELQERSFGVANQVGSTALQIQKSTADFIRLGKSQQKLWLAPLYRNV